MTRTLLAFSAFMWLAQFSPGPDMLLLMKNAVNHTRRAALASVLGIVTGLCFHCAVVLSGLVLVLQKTPGFFPFLRTAGGLYLAWLGGRLLWSLRQKQTTSTDGAPPALTGRGGFAQGLMTNLLNVKAVLFLIGAMTAFLPSEAPPWGKWALAGIVLGQALVGWAAFVALLGWAPVRTWFLRWQRPWNAVFGALLLAFGVGALWAGVGAGG